MSFLFDNRTPCEMLADMLARRSPARPGLHHRAKLSASDVLAIRELRAKRVSCPAIALQFGVSVSTVKKIASGERQGHVAAPSAVAGT